jgi:hypothetical protein
VNRELNVLCIPTNQGQSYPGTCPSALWAEEMLSDLLRWTSICATVCLVVFQPTDYVRGHRFLLSLRYDFAFGGYKVYDRTSGVLEVSGREGRGEQRIQLLSVTVLGPY